MFSSSAVQGDRFCIPAWSPSRPTEVMPFRGMSAAGVILWPGTLYCDEVATTLPTIPTDQRLVGDNANASEACRLRVALEGILPSTSYSGTSRYGQRGHHSTHSRRRITNRPQALLRHYSGTTQESRHCTFVRQHDSLPLPLPTWRHRAPLPGFILPLLYAFQDIRLNRQRFSKSSIVAFRFPPQVVGIVGHSPFFRPLPQFMQVAGVPAYLITDHLLHDQDIRGPCA